MTASLFRRIGYAEADAEQAEALATMQADRGLPPECITDLWALLAGAGEGMGRVARLGAWCRFGSRVPLLVRETAVLAAMYATGFEFEIRAHERILAAEAFDAAALATVRDGATDRLASEYRPGVALARAMAGTADVTDAVIAAVQRALG